MRMPAGDLERRGLGREISLNQSGNMITGSAGGTDYFTITSTGRRAGEFTQLNNVWHADTQ